MAKVKIQVKEVSFAKPVLSITPKNEKQKSLLAALPKKDCIVVIGSAGTGKTYVPTLWASMEFLAGRVEKLVLVRPNMACGVSLGFFTGDKNEKMLNWLGPIVTTMRGALTAPIFNKALLDDAIILCPLETIRGSSFSKAIIIVDEVQNMTAQELLAVLTRVGEGSKIIFSGDILQTDIRDSGLSWMLDKIANNSEIQEFTEVIAFDVEDIVRSRMCKAWVKATL